MGCCCWSSWGWRGLPRRTPGAQGPLKRLSDCPVLRERFLVGQGTQGPLSSLERGPSMPQLGCQLSSGAGLLPGPGEEEPPTCHRCASGTGAIRVAFFMDRMTSRLRSHCRVWKETSGLCFLGAFLLRAGGGEGAGWNLPPYVPSFLTTGLLYGKQQLPV